MNNTSEKQQQLIAKLKELFMMDQADLDFGIYRIMNAKHDEIEAFLHDDLLPTIRKTLQAGGKSSDAQQELETAIKNAQELGMNPDDSPKVQELKLQLGAGTNITLEKDEDEIFSNLTTFFSRYYEGGDFLSLRRYKQETYSPLPMNGEEVKLHWANADQYYIKSAESFSNYAFKVGKGSKKKTIRFELVEASTEQNNKKESTGKERRFILDESQPVSLRTTEQSDELIIYFNYQSDTEKRKQTELNQRAHTFISELESDSSLTQNINDWQIWQLELLADDASYTVKNKKRTLLDKYLNDYTAKNSFDYFIHKDLGGFLDRELNFFIKNELLLLDDIVPYKTDSLSSQLLSNERSLRKVVAFRSIAQKLIAFLAQLENFQKKLWLKKKFVLESNYCMTLDRVDNSFYEEIAENQEQILEWVELGFTTKDTKITKVFLENNPYLSIDTNLFGEEFKQRLLAEIKDLDESTNGLLIHSENFQALNLIQERYRKQVKCVFIDPPYNTGGGDFCYKDSYQHSSWLSMILQATNAAEYSLSSDSAMWVTLDDREAHKFQVALSTTLNKMNFISNIAWQKVYSPRMDSKQFSTSFDHLFVFAKSENWAPNKLNIEPNLEQFPHVDNNGRHYRSDPLRKWGKNSLRSDRPNLWYPITSPDEIDVFPIKPDGIEGYWRWQKSKVDEKYDELDWLDKGNGMQPYLRQYADNSTKRPVETFWPYTEVGSTHESNEQLKSLFGPNSFSTPKPTRLIQKVILASEDDNPIVMDYFSGSGTTAHATINLNREDNGNRKYILVEMGGYFDTVIKPRIKKVVYSEEWKSGELLSDNENKFNGISHSFKYIRLESYEDVVDNLQLQRTEQQSRLLENTVNKSLKEDYILNYMLDIEAKGSLLSQDLFIDPFNTQMRVVRDSETRNQKIDLVETFNYLLGLRLQTMQTLKGIVEVVGESPNGESVLVIWRNQNNTDNDTLDEWFRKQSYNTRDMEFDLIYVNGDNNLPNLRTGEESWKVQLIEEVFQTLMFDCQDV